MPSSSPSRDSGTRPARRVFVPPAFVPPSHAALTAAIPFAEKQIRPKPGAGGWWAEMKKTGLAMPQPTVSSRSKCRRHPSGASSES